MTQIVAAQIDANRKVIAFARLDDSMVAENSNWIACAPDQDISDPAAWEVDGSDTLVLSQSRLVTEGMIRAEGARRLRIVAARYSTEERETWHVQIEQSKKYLAAAVGFEPSVPMLAAMANANGTTTRAWAIRIRDNAANFEVAAGHILGKQDALIAMDPRPYDYTAAAWWS